MLTVRIRAACTSSSLAESRELTNARYFLMSARSDVSYARRRARKMSSVLMVRDESVACAPTRDSWEIEPEDPHSTAKATM